MRLGLTGGIGSGKSTVAGLFSKCGATLIDADAVSRMVTGPDGSALEGIKLAFGAEFLIPGIGLDREKMRALAFRQPESRGILESIVHPLVGTELERQLDVALAKGGKLVVLDIPLLFESKRWRPNLDRILVIDCTHETQLNRVNARNGIANDIIAAIIQAQATRSQRAHGADIVLYNDGINLDELRVQVKEIAQEFGL